MTARSFAIIGAGAVGLYYGGRLAQHGRTVHLLVRSDYDALRTDGLTVRSCHGDFALPPDRLHLHRDSSTMPMCDVVLVTLKTTANHRYRELIAPILKDDSIILTLQNGLGNEQALAELFGGHRVMGGLAFTCINRVRPGVVDHSDHGLIRIGEFTGAGDSPRARALAGEFRECNVRCEVLDDLATGRWTKLVWNVPFNGLGALLNLPTDRLLASQSGRKWVKSLMLEILEIAASVGVMLPEALAEKQLADTMTMGSYRTSMQIDRQHGRAMEVDAILYHPLALARQRSISCPHLACLCELMEAYYEGSVNTVFADQER